MLSGLSVDPSDKTTTHFLFLSPSLVARDQRLLARVVCLHANLDADVFLSSMQLGFNRPFAHDQSWLVTENIHQRRLFQLTLIQRLKTSLRLIARCLFDIPSEHF